MTRYVHVAHRLTGRHAVRYRAEQLGLTLSDQQIREITGQIKRLSDEQLLTIEDVDRLLARQQR